MCVCVVSLRCLCTLFVKVSIVGEFMMCAGSPFQSRMVRGKNECMYDLVSDWSIWYFLL